MHDVIPVILAFAAYLPIGYTLYRSLSEIDKIDSKQSEL